MEELDGLERAILDPTAEPIYLTLSSLKLITDDFSTERLIGRGAYAEVYKGTLPNGFSVAVKRLYHRIDDDDRRFNNEVLLMGKAKHKNILRLIGYCYDTQKVPVEYRGKIVFAESTEWCMCLKYASHGSLDKYITDMSGGLEWNYRYRIIRGICDGLHYLHQELHMLHLDLKPANVLLDDMLVPKLTDFGTSRLGEETTVTITIEGTGGYMAPENLHEGIVSLKADIFSLGVTIIEFLTGSKGLLDDDIEQAFTGWKRRLSDTEEGYSLENICLQVRRCLEIAMSCVEHDPDKRPTSSEIIRLLDETESTDYSVSDGHAPPILQHVEEPASADTEQGTPDLVNTLPEELYSLEFLMQITDGFSQERVLEKRGTSGLVYMGKNQGGTEIAVKRLLALSIPEKEFIREAKKLTSLEHSNIVKLVGYCYDVAKGGKLVRYNGKSLLFRGPELLLCYQYMPNRSIQELLFGQGCRELDWHTRYDMIKGTCDGLLYLHEGCENRPIAHLNLSLTNVLLDENKVARITDSGLSWLLIGEQNSKSIANAMRKPRRYMAPEYFLGSGGNMECPTKADIYSLGIMILEIVGGQENHDEKLTKREFWETESQMPSSYSSLKQEDTRQVNLCIDVGLHCVAYKPEKRPTAGDIVQWLNQGHISVPTPAGTQRPPLPVPVRTIRGNEDSGGRTFLGRLFR